MDDEHRRTLEGCQSFSEMVECLQQMPQPLGARDVEFCHRELMRVDEPEALRMAYLGNHTMEPLPRYVDVACARRGLRLRHYTGPYNQYFQDILQPDSDLYKFKPEVIFLSVNLKVLSPDIHGRFLEIDPAGRRAKLTAILDHVEQWVEAATARTDAVCLVGDFTPPSYWQAGAADAQLDMGENEFYLALNLDLRRRLRGNMRVVVLDLAHSLARCGYQRAHEPKMYLLARMEWAEPCLTDLAEELCRHVRAIAGDCKKCLVLDLDDTLWGGVLGEVGAGGVKIGSEDPTAEAFLQFQQAVRALKERGVLLALCSKNNVEDVIEAFGKRIEMPLRWTDFASTRINWDHKYLNVQRIAQELNLGTDSLVFIDDSAMECAMMRQMMPEVTTLQLPLEPENYAPLIRRLDLFETLVITREDRNRSELYRQSAVRERRKVEVADLKKFLIELGTVVVIAEAGPDDLARVYQLFARTNQFNLSTKRYRQGEIENFILDDRWRLWIVDVSDRFGALGIVGLYLVENDGHQARIDSLLLSCRAMGRGVEIAMMNHIKAEYLLSGRCPMVEGLYMPSRKNRPAATYYEQQGFALAEERVDGTQVYQLSKDDTKLVACPGVTVHRKELSDG